MLPEKNKDIKVLILIADGTEEMEFTISYDLLVRAGLILSAGWSTRKRTFIQPTPDKSDLRLSTMLPEKNKDIKVLILIADGTEEMELYVLVLPFTLLTLIASELTTHFSFLHSTISYDLLVRAGFIVTSAYVIANGRGEITTKNTAVATCSRGLRIIADMYFAEGGEGFGPDNYDVLIIPGGAKGAETISNDHSVQKLVKQYYEKDKWVGMICAGALTAKSSGLPNQPITSHPSVQSELESEFKYSDDSVVISGKLVTTRGPGSTFPFILTLIELILGPEKRNELEPPLMFPLGTPSIDRYIKSSTNN
ncbi:hypothetical protein AN958_09124 [Leucoagaricus sp. SymC.cos]|nr:hypothetical protein AN958_09124 [Leucoagaricus sp. SymC.cos]